jgi:elongation factor P hydroxylase
MTLLEQGIPERPARFIARYKNYQTPPLTAEHPWPEDLH